MNSNLSRHSILQSVITIVDPMFTIHLLEQKNMGRLKFKLPSSTVQLPFNDDITPVRGVGENETIFGKAGAETWFTAELEVSSEYEETRLDAAFVYDANDRIDCMHRGRAGFWIGVKDEMLVEEFGSPVFDCGLTEGISVSVNEWNFGEKPRIEFVTEKNNYSRKIVQIAVCVSPYFNISTNGKPQVCNLEFRLSGMKHGFTNYEHLETKYNQLQANDKEEPIQGEALKLRLMKDFKEVRHQRFWK